MDSSRKKLERESCESASDADEDGPSVYGCAKFGYHPHAPTGGFPAERSAPPAWLLGTAIQLRN